MGHRLTPSQEKRMMRLRDALPTEAEIVLGLERLTVQDKIIIAIEISALNAYLAQTASILEYGDLAYFEASMNRLQQIINLFKYGNANS